MFIFLKFEIFSDSHSGADCCAFLENSHKVAKSEYFFNIQNQSESLIDSLSNIVCWGQFSPSKIIGWGGGGGGPLRTTSISYSASVYYSKLLITWANLLQDRRCRPSNMEQILTELLFDNRFLTTGNLGGKRVTFFPGWCKAGITQIQHITYRVIAKMLPSEAIEKLVVNKTKNVTKQHTAILSNIPSDWKAS